MDKNSHRHRAHYGEASRKRIFVFVEGIWSAIYGDQRKDRHQRGAGLSSDRKVSVKKKKLLHGVLALISESNFDTQTVGTVLKKKKKKRVSATTLVIAYAGSYYCFPHRPAPFFFYSIPFLNCMSQVKHPLLAY